MLSRFQLGEEPLKEEQRELYTYRARVGIVIEVFDDVYIRSISGQETVDGQSGAQIDEGTSRRQKYGKVKVKWLDGAGEAPTSKEGVSFSSSFVDWIYGSGIWVMPNIGDLAVCLTRPGGEIIVVGFIPLQAGKLVVDKAQEAEKRLGRIRRLKSGEVSIVSNELGEIYLDRNGSIRGIVRDISKRETFTYPEGSPPKSRVKYGEILAEFVLGTRVTGEIDTSNDYKFKENKEGTKSVRFYLKLYDSGMEVIINEDGDISVNGNSINLNSGSKGVAREDDSTSSTSTEDNAFWAWVSALHAFVVGLGFVYLPGAPSSLAGKISGASSSVKAGD